MTIGQICTDQYLYVYQNYARFWNIAIVTRALRRYLRASKIANQASTLASSADSASSL